MNADGWTETASPPACASPFSYRRTEEWVDCRPSIAEGVIVGSGFTGPAVDFARTNIEKGARESRRQLADLTVWYLAYTALDEKGLLHE